MSSINGIAGLVNEAQVAELNKQSAVKSTDDTTSGMANALSKLNALYSSNGQNNATTGLNGLAQMLGTDTQTLTSELQSGNSAKVSKLLSEQMEMSAITNADSTGTSDSSNGSSSASPLAGLFDSGSGDASSTGNLFDTQL